MSLVLDTLSTITDTVFPRTCAMCGQSDSSLCDRCL